MKGRKSKAEWSGPNNRRGIGRLLVALRWGNRPAGVSDIETPKPNVGFRGKADKCVQSPHIRL
jgi:hypothetical protein